MALSVTRAVALLGLAAGFSALNADAATFESPREPADLIELFTSEGCSSCPPAEQKLSELGNNPELWRRIVPVAFHVDYWDQLGWRDALARREFTERQRAHAAGWGSTTIYTPCFVINGREERGPAPARPSTPRGGRLRLNVDGDGVVEVTYEPLPGAENSAFVVEVVPLGDQLTSRVVRGENAGRTLRHRFVALDLVSAPLQRGGEGAFVATLRLPPSGVTPLSALAAWVRHDGDRVPLQATGGWLKGAE